VIGGEGAEEAPERHDPIDPYQKQMQQQQIQLNSNSITILLKIILKYIILHKYQQE
jgi:hypothetical protein